MAFVTRTACCVNCNSDDRGCGTGVAICGSVGDRIGVTSHTVKANKMIEYLGAAMLAISLGTTPVSAGTVSAHVPSGGLQMAQAHLPENALPAPAKEERKRREGLRERNQKLKAEHGKQGAESRELKTEQAQRKQGEEVGRHEALRERNQKLKAEHARQRETQLDRRSEKVERQRERKVEKKPAVPIEGY